jgi:tetratricopeptide (TPR) repeat protein
MRQIERALELDPQNAFFQAFRGVDLVFLRRFDDAVAAFREALQTSPRLPVALVPLAGALHLKGEFEETIEAERAFRATLGDREGERALELGFSESGYRGAMRRLAELGAQRSLLTRTQAFSTAVLYLRAGDEEEALAWLERAYGDQDPNLPYLGLPLFDSVRDDPRFEDLLRRMNLTMWIDES